MVKSINLCSTACYILQLTTCLHEGEYQYHSCNKNTKKYTDILPGLKNCWVHSASTKKGEMLFFYNETYLEIPVRHPVALKIHKNLASWEPFESHITSTEWFCLHTLYLWQHNSNISVKIYWHKPRETQWSPSCRKHSSEGKWKMWFPRLLSSGCGKHKHGSYRQWGKNGGKTGWVFQLIPTSHFALWKKESEHIKNHHSSFHTLGGAGMVKSFSFCHIQLFFPCVLTVDKYYCSFYCSNPQKPTDIRILIYLELYVQVVEAILISKHSHPKGT